MSTNWKDIGKNSGNMKNHRNVTSNRLNYENGKWDTIYEVSGIDMKGYTFDICGQNVVVGIGTSKPFSRLSLGTSDKNGTFDSTKPGQLSAIALNEKSNGDKFNGILYNTDISGQKKNAGLISGIQLMSSSNGFNINDPNSGRLILGSDNVVTIGGNARIGNESYIPTQGAFPGTTGSRKIVLDTRGSIRTDGYINFYNQTSNNTFEPAGSSYDNHADIPVGSLFLSSGGSGSIASVPGLYFKKSNSGANQVERIGGGSSSGGGSSGGSADSPFDYSLNKIVGSNDYSYIVQKNFDTGYVGGVPITFSGGKWLINDASGSIGYQNALTVRQGNLSVTTISGDNLKVSEVNNSNIKLAFNDISGGIILAEKQILLGSTPDDSTSNPPLRSGTAIIEAQAIDKVPILMSYNYNNSSSSKFIPQKATNAVILLNKIPSETGTGNNANQCQVGTTYDCSHSIIIGGRFKEISTPNSIISNPTVGFTPTTQPNNSIKDPSGCNLVFGYNNNMSFSPFSIIQGANNEINNGTTETDNQVDITQNGGSIIVGTSNKILNNITNLNKKPQNVIFGNNNISNNTENSFVQGSNNINFGDLNVVFGNNNELGYIDADELTTELQFYKTHNSFVQGTSNKIYAPSGETIHNAFVAGKNNVLDLSFNSFTENTNTSYTLFGTYAGISGESYSDTSNVRFAFGTYEKWVHNGGLSTENGNVLTIDNDGHTRIYGSLTVDGSFVKLNVIHKDISDNNITLGSNGYPANGGGITILDNTNGHHGLTWLSTPAIHGSQNYWDTSGADISTNHLFANNIIAQDVSGNDASFNDISAVNFFSVGNSFFGDIHASGPSSFNDVSGNDASFNDISSVNITAKETLHFKDGIVKSDGKMGVGDTDPAWRLSVESGSDVARFTQNNNTPYYSGTSVLIQAKNTAQKAQYATLEMKGTYGGSEQPSPYTITYGSGIRSIFGYSGNARNHGDVRIWTTDWSTNNKTDRMMITGNGKVAIPPSAIPISNDNYDGGDNIFFVTGNSNFDGNITCDDISGNDASFNDISAVNFFSVGNSFFGDIHASGPSSFNDVSGNDASFNDISTNSVTITGTTLYVNGNAFTFPGSSGTLGTAASGGDFPGIGINSGKCLGVGSSNLSNNNFLRINGTTVEGLTDSEMRSALGLGTAAQSATGDFATAAQGTTADNALPASSVSTFGATLIDDTDASTARTTLGLTIGTNVQAYDAGLADIAGLAVTDGNFIVGDGSNWVAETGSTARTSLGLGNVVNESKTTMFTNPTFTGHVKCDDISGNDASFNDISAVNFFGNLVGSASTVSTGAQPSITSVGTLTSLVVSGDLSGNDASFNDISAVNFFSVGNSFFGDIHASGHSSFNDVSGNDASFNDISSVNITAKETLHFKDGIVKSGKMGVGDTDPAWRLSVESGGDVARFTQNNNIADYSGTSVLIQAKNNEQRAQYATLEMKGTYGGTGQLSPYTITYGSGIRSIYGYAGNARNHGDVRIWTTDWTTNNKTDRMMITGNGKVAIPPSAIPISNDNYDGGDNIFFVTGNSNFDGNITCDDISANKIFSLSDAYFGNIRIETDSDAAAGNQSVITTTAGDLVLGAATGGYLDLRDGVTMMIFSKQRAKRTVSKANNSASVDLAMSAASGTNCIINAYVKFSMSGTGTTAGEDLSITLPSPTDVFDALPAEEEDWETSFIVDTINCSDTPTIKSSAYTASSSPSDNNTIFQGRQTNGGSGGTGTSHIALNGGRITKFTIRTQKTGNTQQLFVYWTSEGGVYNTYNAGS